jgi:hypothetical protein
LEEKREFDSDLFYFSLIMDLPDKIKISFKFGEAALNTNISSTQNKLNSLLQPLQKDIKPDVS